MSERGFANWLGIDHMALKRMETNWPPKTLKPFCNKVLTMSVTLATVVAKNCPHKGVDIVVYDVSTMEKIIRGYVVAYTAGTLRKNQLHLGKRCAELLTMLIKSSLRMRIEWACGFEINNLAQSARFWITPGRGLPIVSVDVVALQTEIGCEREEIAGGRSSC